MTSTGSTWFTIPRRVAEPRLRLFCFPFAGGGASTYRPWPTAAALPSDFEVVALALPGRELRMRETPFASLTALLDTLESAPEFTQKLDRPFAFFGHSMGARIAFELTRRLRRRSGPLPLRLIASGARAPQLPRNDAPRHTLDDAKFVAELRRLGGTPESVLAEPELMELLLPVLRADFQLNDTFTHAAEAPLDLPISAFGGASDASVSKDDLEAWHEQTSRGLTTRLFAGGHFFLNEDRTPVLTALTDALERDLARLPPR